MDLQVVGRHALLFDDDAMMAFVNSPDALVDWNSLSIDRYDVRHLLSSPPPPRSRRRSRQSPSLNHDGPMESELDEERYRDLPSESDEQDVQNEQEPENAGGFHTVPFSYGEAGGSTEQTNTDAEPGFQPPFSVPEHLVQKLPPSEKVHQIIARTAMFVSKHGGQSEIVLRVKQGDNPTFGFLMPDHDLHPYFRFLVNHQELLRSDVDGKSLEEENKVESGTGGVGGSLMLLGSVYGSGEDDEAATENSSPPPENDSAEAVRTDSPAPSHVSEKSDSRIAVAGKDEAVSKHSVPSLKERAKVIKRNRSMSTVKGRTTTGLHKQGDALGSVSSTVNNAQSFASPSMSKDEKSILEPPSDMKRVVERIVEFILKNGKEFEAVLVQQDTKHGRFPFLLPYNQYHPYYLKALHRAQESRLAGKGIISDKNDSVGHRMVMKSAPKDSISQSMASDIPYDSDRKEKFKMVIGKSRKDGQETTSKVVEQHDGVSVDAAAAILQAARKGVKNPNLDILSRASMKGINQGCSSDGGEPGSSLFASRSQNSFQKLEQNAEPGVSVPMAMDIAKSAAIEASGEADSSEASLTRDQKLKAERLKRAKMFAAMIKSGAAPLKSEPLRGLSLEPPESGFSGSGADGLNNAGKEREGSTVPLDIDTSGKNEKPEKKESADSYNERRLKRMYRSRSNRVAEDEAGEEKVVEEDSDHKHSRKKKRSRHSSRHIRDRHKHGRRHASSMARGSRHWHKSDSDLVDELQHSSEQYNQDSFTDDDHMHSRIWQNQDGSSDDDHRHTRHKHDYYTSDVEHKQSDHRQKDDISLGGKHQKQSHHKHKHDSSSEDEHRKRTQHRSRRDSFFEDGHRKHARHRIKHESSSEDEYRKHTRHRSKRGTSSEDEHKKHTRQRRKHDSSSEDEHQKHSQHRCKNDSSTSDEHSKHSLHKQSHHSSDDELWKHSHRRHNYDRSSDEEQRPSRHQHKHVSSDDEHLQQIKSAKRKKSQSQREADLEEGEILAKSDQSKASEGGNGASREASVDISKSYQDQGGPSQPSGTTEVSDDLRAKIRAMLMATY